MDRKPLFVQWCPKDAIDGMMFLDPFEELAYRRLIDFIYLTNDNLQDDDKKLRHMLKVGNKWKNIKKTLIDEGKIVVIDGKITNKTCKKVLEKVREKSALAKAAVEAREAKKQKRKPLKSNELDLSDDHQTMNGRSSDDVSDDTKKQHKNASNRKPIEKNKQKKKTSLAIEFPSIDAQKKALTYWKNHNVPADLELQIFKFRAHHTDKGTTSHSWDSVWQTWYSNQREWTSRDGKFGQPTGTPYEHWKVDATVELPIHKAPDTDTQWRQRVQEWVSTKRWSQQAFGSEEPDSPFTSVPNHILQEFDLGKGAA